MMKRIYQWLAGIGAGLAALAWLLLQRRTSQRDDARRERDSAQRSEQATQAKAHKDADIRDAGAQARAESAEHRRKRNETPKHDRRTGRAGTLDRLRDDAD